GRLACLALLLGVAAVTASSGASAPAGKPKPGGGGTPSFGADVVLPGGQGAEPSYAIDTSPTASRGSIYVVAIGDSNGPLEWHSYSSGKRWSEPVPFDLDGPLRGGDSDVAVNTNGDVIVDDLDVTWTGVQISTDQGKTFGPT